MTPAGRPTKPPHLRKQKVNLQYTSVERWAYDELVLEAQRIDSGGVKQQIDTALMDRAKKLKKARKARERRQAKE
jgi:hypothetical protein